MADHLNLFLYNGYAIPWVVLYTICRRTIITVESACVLRSNHTKEQILNYFIYILDNSQINLHRTDRKDLEFLSK